MVWGGCGLGAPTGQTIRWQLELLLLKTHLCRGFQVCTGPVIFWFQPWHEALALVIVWGVVYVVRQELSTFCILNSAALGCPMWSLCPSRALGVVSSLLPNSYQWRYLPSVGECSSPSARVGQTSWRKSVFDFGGNIYISLDCVFFFFLSVGLCQLYYIEGTLSWGRKLQ